MHIVQWSLLWPGTDCDCSPPLPRTYEARVGDFVLMNGSMDPPRLALGALRLYATFIATNASRYGRVLSAGDAWVQAVVDVVGRDSSLQRIYNAVWNSPDGCL